MIRAIRSYFVTMKAVRSFGRAAMLRERGNNEAALVAVRAALDVLRKPVVVRSRGSEGSALCGCTILAEELASELGQPGAQFEDFRDTLTFLEAMPPECHEYQAWIPYLRSKVKGMQSAV